MKATGFAVLFIALPLIALPLSAATRTWIGSNSGMWSDPANWDGAAPVDGDDLVFPAGSSNMNTTNDLAAGTSFHSISNPGGGYTLQGNGIVLGDGGLDVAGGLGIAFDITLGASQSWTVTGAGDAVFSCSSTSYCPPGPSASISLNGHDLTLNTPSGFAYSFWFDDPIDGPGNLAFAGDGAIELRGAISSSGTIANNGASVMGLPRWSPAMSYTQTAGSLRGCCQVGDVAISGGSLVPVPLSSFNTGNLSFTSGATYRITENSPCECIYVGKSIVTGSVGLGDASLVVDVGFIPSGWELTIIDNDGSDPVDGTFAGLPEGATVISTHFQPFTITYTGGTGNDVVITAHAYSTTTSLASSPNPAVPGQSVTFTATVSTDAGGMSFGGTVTFFDDANTLGTTSTRFVDGNLIATLNTSALAAGSHNITARFNGSGYSAPSTSPVLMQVVQDPGPSIAFGASPSMIGIGQSSMLSWSVTNATSVSIDHGIGPQPNTGSIFVTPGSTTIYSLTAIGVSDSSTASVWVIVVPMPEITFTATPQSILPGTPVTLQWSTSNATSVFIDNGLGFVNLAGTVVVAPRTTTTYVITATGIAGTVPATTTVTVIPPRNRAVRH